MSPIPTDSSRRLRITARVRLASPGSTRLPGVRARGAAGVFASVLVVASCAASPSPASGAAGPAVIPSAPGPSPPVSEGRVTDRSTAVQAASDTLSTIQVSGSAQVEVEADQARVTFAVETEAETAQEASRQNAERMDAVLSGLRRTDLPGLEIETRGYSLQPRYRRPDDRGTREIDGFTARNLVEVTIDAPTSAGALIDAGIGAGANRVASLGFLASNTDEARLEALRNAVTSAREEAEAIAGALGMSLGRPLEVTGGADRGSPQPMVLRMEAGAFQDAPTPVEPGSQTVSASVTIRYALRDSEP